MNANSAPSLASASLAGARIWLSGSLPESEGSTESERAAVMEFVRRFSSTVFRLGGHVLHGSHPTFTPTLLQEAENHQKNGGKKDCLTLAVSRYWSKVPSKVPVDEWRKKCMVFETPEASGQNAQDDSLDILSQACQAPGGGCTFHQSQCHDSVKKLSIGQPTRNWGIG